MNIHAAGDIALFIIGAATAAAPVFFHPDMTVPYIGVPTNVLVAACGGAISGFAFAKKEESRYQMFKTAFACVVVGCALTTLTVALIEWWLKVEMAAKLVSAMAVVIAFLSRWVLPAVIERVPGWLDKLPFVNKSK